MKIFCVDRPVGQWPVKVSGILAGTGFGDPDCLKVRLVADSAVNRNDRPVFVPDFAAGTGWVVEIMPAIQIGRLGKFISPRFARRYISGVMLAAFLHPADEHEVNILEAVFDGALTAGVLFQDVVEEFAEDGLKIEACSRRLRSLGEADAGAECLEADLSWGELHAEDTVALLSRFCTLKSGDLILPASSGVAFPVATDVSLSARLNGRDALKLRLK